MLDWKKIMQVKILPGIIQVSLRCTAELIGTIPEHLQPFDWFSERNTSAIQQVEQSIFVIFNHMYNPNNFYLLFSFTIILEIQTLPNEFQKN